MVRMKLYNFLNYNFGSLKSLKTLLFGFSYASDMGYMKSFWNESLAVSYTVLKVIQFFWTLGYILTS